MTVSRFDSLPALRRRSTQPFFTTATPAESYPRYSSRRSPSINTGTTSFGPMYPMIPHINVVPLSLPVGFFRFALRALALDPAVDVSLRPGADRERSRRHVGAHRRA